MWIEIFKIIGSVGIAYLFTKSLPITLLKRKLGFKEEEDYKPFKNFFNTLLYCTYCASFWISIPLYFIPESLSIIWFVGIITLVVYLFENKS